MDNYEEKIKELEFKRSEVLPTEQQINEALEHHLQQLQRSGATLEDDVCQILRKMLEAAELTKEIEENKLILKRHQRENGIFA